jgi:hypothetical protein
MCCSAGNVWVAMRRFRTKWYCANGLDLAFPSTAYAIGSIKLSLPRSLFINTEVWALRLPGIYSQGSWLSYLLSFFLVHWVHLYGSEEGACSET